MAGFARPGGVLLACWVPRCRGAFRISGKRLRFNSLRSDPMHLRATDLAVISAIEPGGILGD